jgi:ribonuclease D
MSSTLKPPAKSDILLLEQFQGLTLAHIAVPATPQELLEAWEALSACPVLGFDTESRPTFRKGEVATGPHLVQFSTPTKAYLFQTHCPQRCDVVRQVLSASSVLKVGFGLRSDQEQLESRLGLRARPVLDLDGAFRAQGYPCSIGVKAAIAMLFHRRLMKSKRVTTSNWSQKKLEPAQLLYAANDAYAALRVFLELRLPLKI